MEEARNTAQNQTQRAETSAQDNRVSTTIREDVSFARSQDVDLYQVTFAKDSAWPFLVELGTTARCVEFIDLNRNAQTFHLPHTHQIKACDEALSKLKFLMEECNKAHIELSRPRDLEQFNSSLHKLSRSKATSETVIFDLIVKDVKEKAEFIKTQHSVVSEMKKQIQDMELQKTALQTVSSVLSTSQETEYLPHVGRQDEQESLLGQGRNNHSEAMQMVDINQANRQQNESSPNQFHISAAQEQERDGGSFQSQLNVVAGVIKEGEVNALTRLLYRVSRGKVASFFENVGTGFMDQSGASSGQARSTGTAQPVSFAAFVLVFSDSDYLLQKVLRITQSYTKNTFQMPKGQSDRDRAKQVQELDVEIAKAKDLLVSTRARLRDYLASIQAIDPSSSSRGLFESSSANNQSVATSDSPLAQLQAATTNQIDLFVLYELFLERERLIFITLNKFRAEASHLLMGFCWIPSRDIDKAKQALKDVHEEDPRNLEMPRLFRLNPDDYRTDISPPTYIITNEFTYTFQMIVDLFDVPKYKEMNPALFTCVSFPFLFGVMFGDICHGSILLLVGIILCILKRRSSEYDLAANPDSLLNNLFKVRHVIVLLGFFSTYCGLMYNDFASIPLSVFGSCYQIKGTTATQEPDCVMPTGIDVTWYLASNELAYVNSMKMKIAVILGVVHMTLGIVLKGCNLIYFSRKIDFFFEFIPQLLILLALFGYMDFLIIVKWLTDFTGIEDKAPSIIQTMIAMFINMGAIPENTVPLLGTTGKGQQTVSLSLLCLVVICVPTLLCCKPCLLHRGSRDFNERVKKSQGDEFVGVQLVVTESGAKAKKSDDEEELLDSQNRSPVADHERSPPGDAINFSGSDHRESYLLSVEYAEEAKNSDWRRGQETISGFYAGEQLPPQSPESEAVAQKPAKLLKLLREATADEGAGHDNHEEGGFGILMIHQLIETIEFVLGTVSNTASYLRLWALSLAHSQLASVFFDFTVKSGLDTEGTFMSVVMIFIGFVIFASCTVGVMMCMDVMECFLHTLRLHWVEFQSKFYVGGGHAFAPSKINENLPVSLTEPGLSRRLKHKRALELRENPKKLQ